MSGQLTGREKSCLHWVAQGKTSWEIGSILRISEHTVNFHLKNAMAKLFTSKRTVAALVAMEKGFFSPSDAPDCNLDLSSLKKDQAVARKENTTQ